jgi:hypothetical protein
VLSDWLTVLRPHLVEPLFCPAAIARLGRLASRLPVDGPGVLEVRLAPGPGPVDLSLRLKDPAQAGALAERISPPHLASFLRRWPELQPIHSIWLEFDLDREPRDLPIPIVCAKLFPDTRADWIMDRLIPALQGKPLDPDQRPWIALCLREIPPPATLLYVFSLLSREGGAIRLEILGLSPAGILGYLKRLAPPAVSWVEGTAALFEGVERLHLSLDIGPGILPRIGIEGSFPRLPRREPRWGQLFDRLVSRGFCAPEKRDAALAWPGYDSFWTAAERWAMTPGFCIRGLSHVKMVCRPDREPEAKVYLTFGPLDRSGAAGAASSPASRSASST